MGSFARSLSPLAIRHSLFANQTAEKVALSGPLAFGKACWRRAREVLPKRLVILRRRPGWRDGRQCCRIGTLGLAAAPGLFERGAASSVALRASENKCFAAERSG